MERVEDEKEEGFEVEIKRFEGTLVYNAVCNANYHEERPYLLIDTRERAEAQALSIPTAISLPQPGAALATFEDVLQATPMSERKRADLEHRDGRTCILFAAGKGESAWLLRLLSLLQSEGRVGAAGILKGGFSGFLQIYPWLLTNTAGFRCPNEILAHNLFLGNLEHAMDPSVIQGMGITHIVNASCLQQKLYAQRDGVEYFNIDIDDAPEADLEQYFEPVVEFIEDALGQGAALATAGSVGSGGGGSVNSRTSSISPRQPRVLVHCNAGMSRSSSLVMAYLIKAKHMTLRASYDLCQRARHIVAPNLGFRRQLLDWELKCIGTNSATEDELADLGYDGGHLTRHLYHLPAEGRTSRARSTSSVDGVAAAGASALRGSVDVPVKFSEESPSVWRRLSTMKKSHGGDYSCVVQ